METKSTSSKIAFRIIGSVFRFVLNVLFYILIATAIISVSRQAYTFTYQIYGDVSVEQAPGRDILFQINKGESSMDISKKLEINRLIVDKNPFLIKAKLQKANILPGTYRLNTSMTYEQILDNITNYSASIVHEDIDN
ncbi:MAG TPA: endolytic transglycosylase MltG [Clostridiales bacterium]|nr:endolytic transglycosylase MltG [Clostridiales bacterium]